ncbi:protein YigP clustered with ubiquinone biosynthetic genes [Klebsiella pneumoniae]|uniref:Ubiquinone biosynthesis accessory factor UbiJ n=2 Tax=Enterobacteriaceae TaxID=543 RepID=A0A377TI03_KLEPN|nr:protein YigP clustered with ubiquinone biosynthetic genes [Klebsiella pneumoniae]
MPFTPLVTAGIETALNTFLWRDKRLTRSPAPAGQGIAGPAAGFRHAVVLVFSERQVDVLSAWDGEADCTVITRLSVLPKLRNRQQLTALIRSGDLEVQGDLQVVQNMVSLCDLAEFDPAELLAPYTGDIVAEGVGKVLRGGAQFLLKGAERQQRYVAEAITEEWRLAPGPLELAWFAEETTAIERALAALEKRLERWRANDARRITAPVFHHPHLFELRAR